MIDNIIIKVLLRYCLKTSFFHLELMNLSLSLSMRRFLSFLRRRLGLNMFFNNFFLQLLGLLYFLLLREGSFKLIIIVRRDESFLGNWVFSIMSGEFNHWRWVVLLYNCLSWRRTLRQFSNSRRYLRDLNIILFVRLKLIRILSLSFQLINFHFLIIIQQVIGDYFGIVF